MSATITATFNSSSQTATLKVVPTTYVLSLSLNPSTVVEGNSVQGTVRLAAAAPSSGWNIYLTSQTSNVYLPPSITIGPGQTTGTFTGTVQVTGTAYSDTITASDANSAATATLTVQKGPLISNLTLSPSALAAGGYSTGTVTLSFAAPTAGWGVTLSSSNSNATVPTSITIAAGQTTGQFIVTAQGASSEYSAQITATCPTSSSSATLTVAGEAFRAPIFVQSNPPFGVLDDALALPEWLDQTIPRDQSDAAGGGPGSIFSVSLPFGAVDVDTGADLSVQDNMVGTLEFGLRYRTALAAGAVSSPGLPAGWTHNWDYRIVNTQPGQWGPLKLVYPNGATDTIVPYYQQGDTSVTFAVPTGSPYTVTGVPDAVTAGLWDSITVSYDGNRQDQYTQASGDSSLRLVKRVYQNNSSVSLTYSSGELQTIAGGSNSISVSYTGGIISSATAASPGTVVNYGCPGGALTTISNVATGGTMWIFSYATVGSDTFLSQATTYGFSGGVSYDAYGRASNLTDGNGNLRSYNYTANSSTAVTVGPISAPVDSMTETSDSMGRVTSWTNAAGNKSVCAYNGSFPQVLATASLPSGQTVTVSSDSMGNPTKVLYPYGNYTMLSWNYPTGFPHGQLASTKEYAQGGSTSMPATTYTYFTSANAASPASIGALQQVIYPDSTQANYTYTTLGSLKTITRTGADGTLHTTQFNYAVERLGVVYNEMIDKPYQIIDPKSNITSITYGNAGIASVWDPYGNTVTGTFNSYNQLTQLQLPAEVLTYDYQVPGKPSNGTTAANASTSATLNSIQHDNEFSPTNVTGAAQLESTSNLSPQYLLNKLVNGNSVTMHSFVRTPATNTSSYTIGSGTGSSTWSQLYDQDGNLHQLTTPLAVQTNTYNNGFLGNIAVWGNTATYSYDGFGRLTDTVSLGGIEHQYSYNYIGQLTSDVTLGSPVVLGGTAVTYTYTLGGARQTMTVYPNGLGNYGVVCTYSYDACDNLQGIAISDTTGASTAAAGVQYTYDDDNRVVAVRTPQLTTLYTYNSMGQVSALQNLTADNLVDDTTTQSTDPYDGSLHSLLSQYSSMTYDIMGNRTGIGSFKIRNQYPQTYFTGSASYTYSTSGTATYLSGETWNQSGLLLGGYPQPATYSYSYGMDAGGNVSVDGGSQYQVNPNTDQLTSLTYDAAGEQSTWRYGGLNCYYDPFGELIQLATPSPLFKNYITNTYDTLGLRASRQNSSNGNFDSYGYDGDRMVCRDNIVYVWGPTGLIQEIPTTGNGFEWPYSIQGYCFDPNGNTLDRAAVNTNGNTPYTILDDPLLYNAYGSPLWYLSSDFPSQLFEPSGGTDDLNNLIFRFGGQAGYVTDTETNMVYCHHRFYDPSTSRWITRDPTGLDGGVNTYQYCDGLPLTNVDPSGCVIIKLISYRVFNAGWHRGIVIEDNMGHNLPYSFAGGPQHMGVNHYGGLVSKSGPWAPGTQDFDQWQNQPETDTRVITLVNDTSSYASWVAKFKSIEGFIASKPMQDYGPIPSDFHLWGGKTANSNTWAHYLLRKAGLMRQYQHALDKLFSHDLPFTSPDLPYAPGWEILLPYNDAPRK